MSNDLTGETKASPRRRLSILLVDDNRLNVILLTETLKVDGHLVTVAIDGSEAVKKASTQVFDLIFMDVQMPGMDGTEATRIIRSLPRPYRDVPIIALTAGSFAINEQQCLAAGMNAYLTKPVDLGDLQLAIIRLFPDAPPLTMPHHALSANIVDNKRIEDLLSTMGKEGVLRVVSLFAPDAENILANIAVLVAKEAINKDECQELALQVHNMKASAKFLGLSSLAEEAVFFECAIGNNQFKIWPDLLVALRKEVELANCELAAIVKRIV